MFLSAHQRECLEKMGIPLYEKRGKAYYWVCIDEELTEPKQQLLSRMLAALRWPIEQCITFHVEAITKQEGVPVAGILLSDRSHSVHEQIIQLPSLQKLLNDVGAKREAWKKMQGIIC